MYSAVLLAHSWWRWVVIMAGIVTLLTCWKGMRDGVSYDDTARTTGRLFALAIDIQFLLGASLYLVLSPITTVALNVADGLPIGTELRFFGVYHGLIMSGVFVDIHVCAILIRRSVGDLRRYRLSLVLYGQVMALLLLSIPWWRPWLRF